MSGVITLVIVHSAPPHVIQPLSRTFNFADELKD